MCAFFFICFFSLLFYVPNAVSDSLCNSGRKFEYFMHKMQNHTIPKKTYRYGYMLLTFWSKKNRKLKKKKWILPMVWTRSIPTYCLTYWSFFSLFFIEKKDPRKKCIGIRFSTDARHGIASWVFSTPIENGKDRNECEKKRPNDSLSAYQMFEILNLNSSILIWIRHIDDEIRFHIWNGIRFNLAETVFERKGDPFNLNVERWKWEFT